MTSFPFPLVKQCGAKMPARASEIHTQCSGHIFEVEQIHKCILLDHNMRLAAVLCKHIENLMPTSQNQRLYLIV